MDSTTPTSSQLELPASLTVKQLADILKVDMVKVIKQLMRKGIMANVNQTIDFDTAAMVVASFGYSAQPKLERHIPQPQQRAIKGHIRPPVITIMGHVDHGKTTLLDAIRSSKVASHEAGSITQHIGAYQSVVDGREITFLDTPGHEAFTAMRAHGANVTDIVVLVVAADDGVMPQTTEAIDHAKAAGVPIVVAINKIDKPEANIERTKQQLADQGLLPEGWGGDTVCVPISAKKKQGLSDLLENLFLVADILELKADFDHLAEGVVIEARLDKFRGSLATLLVQSGVLKPGNIVVAGSAWGKIKAMFNDKGERVGKAEPSTPVEILGLDGVPEPGDIFHVTADEHQARSMAIKQETVEITTPWTLNTISSQVSEGKIKEVNVILKADVQGSIEPIKSSIERLGEQKVKPKIIHAATGSITENDILLALASKGFVIGFNTRPTAGAQQLAEKEGVSIYYYNVIYKLVEDVDKALKGMLEPTYREVLAGYAEVRAIFSGRKVGKIAGVYVKEGKMDRGAQVKIRRQNKVIHESRVSSLRRFKEDVTEVAAGVECGIGIEGFTGFQIDDTIEAYRKERVS